mgnify:CR=1 FL=1
MTPSLPTSLRASLEHTGLSERLFSWVAPEEVPEPENHLLVHGGDLTTTLEAHHGERIALGVLESGETAGRYFREVILSGARSGKPFEFGLIEFELDHFPPELREAIVAEEIPLGTLLTESGFPFRSTPRGFFSVARHDLPPRLSQLGTASVFYGRYNQLSTDEGIRLNAIIEILPRDTDPHVP